MSAPARIGSRPALTVGALALLGLGAATATGVAMDLNRPALRGEQLAQAVWRVDINTAPAHELMLLPRIGPVLATRIVQDRLDAGPFVDLENLQRVRGIGPRTAAGLSGFVTLR